MSTHDDLFAPRTDAELAKRLERDGLGLGIGGMAGMEVAPSGGPDDAIAGGAAEIEQLVNTLHRQVLGDGDNQDSAVEHSHDGSAADGLGLADALAE